MFCEHKTRTIRSFFLSNQMWYCNLQVGMCLCSFDFCFLRRIFLFVLLLFSDDETYLWKYVWYARIVYGTEMRTGATLSKIRMFYTQKHSRYIYKLGCGNCVKEWESSWLQITNAIGRTPFVSMNFLFVDFFFSFLFRSRALFCPRGIKVSANPDDLHVSFENLLHVLWFVLDS